MQSKTGAESVESSSTLLAAPERATGDVELSQYCPTRETLARDRREVRGGDLQH